MKRISFDAAIKIHSVLTARTGGDAGLRDEGLLRAALDAPFQTFGGEELYPTVEKKAARLGHSLIANHAFVDGNKRIGMLLILVFLKINGREIKPEVGEVSRIGFATARGEVGPDALYRWICSNAR